MPKKTHKIEQEHLDSFLWIVGQLGNYFSPFYQKLAEILVSEYKESKNANKQKTIQL